MNKTVSKSSKINVLWKKVVVENIVSRERVLKKTVIITSVYRKEN